MPSAKIKVAENLAEEDPNTEALKASRKVTEGLVKLGQNFTMRSFSRSSFLKNHIRF